MLRSSNAAAADLPSNPKGRRPFARRQRRSSSMIPPASYPPRFWAATKIPSVAAASGFVRVPNTHWPLTELSELARVLVNHQKGLEFFLWQAATLADISVDQEAENGKSV